MNVTRHRISSALGLILSSYLATGAAWAGDIHKAIASGDLVKVQTLVKADAKAAVEKDEYGQLPLTIAVYRDRAEIVRVLLAKGADADRADADGDTPLHLAARDGRDSVALALMGSAKKLDATESHSGYTPLHLAAAYGHSKIAAALLKHGADPNVKDASGRTALDYAAKHGHSDIVAMLSGDPKPSAPTTRPALPANLAKGQARVWYTGHSGWAVQTASHLLVFDYYKPGKNRPASPGLDNGCINPDELKALPITAFASHEHGDHFDPGIFRWKGNGLKVDYVYGFKPADDGKKKYSGPAYTSVGPQEQKTIGDMKVASIKSLDTGGAFLVEVDGLVIFHAGDHANLNSETREAYDKEIAYLATLTDHVDVAFLPVSGCPSSWKRDQVIEGFFSAVETLKVTTAFPMHGLGREWDYREFATIGESRAPKTSIVCAEFPGDAFEYPVAGSTAAAAAR